MTSDTFKRAAIIAAIIARVASGPVNATGIPVFDLSTFQQSLITARQAVQQVANQITQITNQIAMIQNQIRSLQTLGVGTFLALTGNLGDQLAQIRDIIDTVRGVRFQIAQIDSAVQRPVPDPRRLEGEGYHPVRPLFQPVERPAARRHARGDEEPERG